MTKRGLLALAILILFVSSVYMTVRGVFPDSTTRQSLLFSDAAPAAEVRPTPFLYQELTIPYLRNRSYESSLGELRPLSETSTYTSHLTSYNSDGLRINALLTIPKGQQPDEGFPAVVFVHGYIPPASYQTTERYESYIDYLARNGLVVFKIDLRGHGDSEGEASGAYYSGDYVIDVLNAYAALEGADFVDANRINVWGHSMAGNVVLRAVAAKRTIPRAVIWGGAGFTYQDLIDLRISDASYNPPPQESERRRRREELNQLYGPFSQDSWFWKTVPATNYLTDVTTSIQLHHAVNDDVVSIEYSRGLVEAAEAVGKDIQLYEYRTGGHNIDGASFTQAMQRTVEMLTN